MAEHVLIVAALSSILFLIGSLVTKHKDRNHRIDDKLVEWIKYRIYHYFHWGVIHAVYQCHPGRFRSNNRKSIVMHKTITKVFNSFGRLPGRLCRGAEKYHP